MRGFILTTVKKNKATTVSPRYIDTKRECVLRHYIEYVNISKQGFIVIYCHQERNLVLNCQYTECQYIEG